MLTRITCPICSKRLKASLDLVGKSVKCPKCRSAIIVPDESQDQRDRPRSYPRGLVPGAIAIVMLALVLSTGLITGHRQGILERRHELADTQLKLESTTGQLEMTNSRIAELNSELEKREGEHGQLKQARDAAEQDRNAGLAEAKRREEAAAARIREMENSIPGAIAEEADALLRRREEWKRIYLCLPEIPIYISSYDIAKMKRNGIAAKWLDAEGLNSFIAICDKEGKKLDGESAFALQLAGKSNRVTKLSGFWETSCFVFSGSFDEKQLIEDAKKFEGRATTNQVTTKASGKYSLVRLGDIAFTVIDDSHLVMCSSLPPFSDGARGPIVFSFPDKSGPGQAENKLKELINRPQSWKPERVLPGGNQDWQDWCNSLAKSGDPIVFSIASATWYPFPVTRVQLGSGWSTIHIRIQGDEIRVRSEVTIESDERARQVETSIAEYVKAPDKITDESGKPWPLARFMKKKASVTRRNSTVWIEAAFPAETFGKLMELGW